MKSYIVYRGAHYTVEWYYDSRGRSVAKEYYQEQTAVQQSKLLALIVRMADRGKIFDLTKFNNEGDGIYAFKPRPDRYLCFFFKEKRIIITNAFTKKVQKIPAREKERAIGAYNDYKNRVIRGDYYEY